MCALVSILSPQARYTEIVRDLGKLCSEVPAEEWGSIEVKCRLGDLDERASLIQYDAGSMLGDLMEAFYMNLDCLTIMNVAMNVHSGHKFDEMTRQANGLENAATRMMDIIEERKVNGYYS